MSIHLRDLFCVTLKRYVWWYTVLNVGICNLEWSDLKFQGLWVSVVMIHICVLSCFALYMLLVIATSYYCYSDHASAIMSQISRNRRGHCPQKRCTGGDDDSPSFWHHAVRQHLVSGERCFFKTPEAYKHPFKRKRGPECECQMFNCTECYENCVTSIQSNFVYPPWLSYSSATALMIPGFMRSTFKADGIRSSNGFNLCRSPIGDSFWISAPVHQLASSLVRVMSWMLFLSVVWGCSLVHGIDRLH